jgi:hypothetical protein
MRLSLTRVLAFAVALCTVAAIGARADEGPVIEYPSGFSGTQLPATFTKSRIVIPVVINGTTLHFLLDTGSPRVWIDDNAALAAHLRSKGAYRKGSLNAILVNADSVRIGPLIVHDALMRETEFPHPPEEPQIDGLLGFDFIAGSVLKIDYPNQTLEAFDPATFEAPASAYCLPLRFVGDHPMISVVVNGVPSTDFILDTGSSGMAIFGDFANRATSNVPIPSSTSPMHPVHGFGWSMQAYEAVASFSTDSPLRPSSLTAEVSATNPLRGVDGILGWSYLRPYVVYLDYSRRCAYLMENATPSGPGS